LVREVHGHRVTAREWTPRDFRLAPCDLRELVVEGPPGSAAAIQEVFHGNTGPAGRMVVANAAAALLAAEHVGTLAEGVAKAWDCLLSGQAKQVVERLRQCAHRTPGTGA
jgi:anthranilate phosphoribosyltransferase